RIGLRVQPADRVLVPPARRHPGLRGGRGAQHLPPAARLPAARRPGRGAEAVLRLALLPGRRPLPDEPARAGHGAGAARGRRPVPVVHRRGQRADPLAGRAAVPARAAGDPAARSSIPGGGPVTSTRTRNQSTAPWTADPERWPDVAAAAGSPAR